MSPPRSRSVAEIPTAAILAESRPFTDEASESVASTLAAKLERARQSGAQLDQATDDLNAALMRAEAAITKLRLGVSARVSIADKVAAHPADNPLYRAELAFMKDANRWGLFVCVSYDGGITDRITPLSESSKWSRFSAAKMLPALMDAMIESVSNQVVDARALVVEVDSFTKTLEDK